MDGPYRTAWEPPRAHAAPASRGWEEAAIPMVVLVIGGIRAVPALLRDEDFGASATFALSMVVLGLLGIGFDLVQRLRR